MYNGTQAYKLCGHWLVQWLLPKEAEVKKPRERSKAYIAAAKAYVGEENAALRAQIEEMRAAAAKRDAEDEDEENEEGLEDEEGELAGDEDGEEDML